MRAVGRALPVVEEEEHRRTLCDGAEQIAELAHRMRANHVAVVLREIESRLSLARENAEVILPEIDHHFIELPLARHGPRQLHRLQLPDDLLRLSRGAGELRILREELTTRLLFARRRICAGISFDSTLKLLDLIEVANDVRRLRVQYRVMSRQRIGFAVIDALGVELRVNPSRQAHASYFRGIAWARTKGQTVERLLNLFVGEKLAVLRGSDDR